MPNRYLSKHASKIKLINDPPDPDLAIFVVIPSFDEPDLDLCLDHLIAAEKPDDLAIEILIVLNYPESASSKIVQSTGQMVEHLAKYTLLNIPGFKIHVQQAVFSNKQAGVGLARKTGMDEAVRRFHDVGKDGIIVNLDADCIVAENYFIAIRDFYAKHPEAWAAGIHFEHRLDEGLPAPYQDAIMEYELHLRYFIAAQRAIGLPFGFQTIGSCMTVRSSAYQRMGGMNVRQAGEDFYFLHKFIAINRFAEINETTVYPSARASNRVPFGTGRAIKATLNGQEQQTYAWSAFSEVKDMVSQLQSLYESTQVDQWIEDLPPTIQRYMLAHNGLNKLREIKKETSSYETFLSRYYQWFNAFRLMKYLHFARSTYPDRPVINQALEFLQEKWPHFRFKSPQHLLQTYRDLASGLYHSL